MEVAPRLRGAARVDPVPQLTGQLRQLDQWPLGQATGQPGAAGHEPGDEPLADGAAFTPIGRRVRCPRGFLGGRRRPTLAPRGRGPGHRRDPPDAISAARASSAAVSAAVSGHIGLKLYHWSGAAAITRSSASAISWVARRISAGAVEATRMGSIGAAWKRPPGSRRADDRQDRPHPSFRPSVAGPAGSVVQASEQPDRDVLGPVAPVDQQGQHLASLEHPVDLAQVAPRDDRGAPPGALARGAARTARGRSSRRPRRRQWPAPRTDAGRRSPRCCRHGRPRRSTPFESRQISSTRSIPAGSSSAPAASAAHRRQAHQLDEVARVARDRPGAPSGARQDRPAAAPARGRSWRSTSAASTARAGRTPEPASRRPSSPDRAAGGRRSTPRPDSSGRRSSRRPAARRPPRRWGASSDRLGLGSIGSRAAGRSGTAVTGSRPPPSPWPRPAA